MNSLNIIASIVAVGLTALTLKGTLSLTDNVLIAILISAILPLQWILAKRAAIHLRYPISPMSPVRAIVYGALWLIFATITVPLESTPLFTVFSATATATDRFDSEQRRLESRATEIGTDFSAISASLTELVKYSASMTSLEERKGGSCLVNLRQGVGEIYRFREGDQRSSAILSNQAKPELERIQSALQQIKSYRYGDRPVNEVRRELNKNVDQLNAVANAPVLEGIAEFVATSKTRAANIPVKGQTQTLECKDETRSLLLAQLNASVEKLKKNAPLGSVLLLDPKDDRFIAQAQVYRTLNPVLTKIIPASWRNNISAVDPDQLLVFNVRSDGALLTSNNFSLWIGWLLELVMISLIVLSVADPRSRKTNRWHSVRQSVGGLLFSKVMSKKGLWGELATSIHAGLTSPSLNNPYVDIKSIFFDEEAVRRAEPIAKYYRLYGSNDMLILPTKDTSSLRAARELERLGFLKRRAYAISTKELTIDRWLAATLLATSERLDPNGIWNVYEITDDELARWILTRPVDERKTKQE